jgi:nitroreductase
MTPEELLTTTRSVRRRLDLARPVPRELLVECLEITTQAPTGSNRQQWQWVIVTDADKRGFIGECYRKSWYAYAAGSRPTFGPEDPRAERQEQVRTSARYLADHMGEVPALVIACIEGRVEGQDNLAMAGLYGSILPAAWSFMLELAAVLARLQEPIVSCASTVSQKAAEAALRGPQVPVDAMCAAYRRRRDLAVDIVGKAGLLPAVPHGAFYMLVDVSTTDLDTATFARELVLRDRVAVAPGETFGAGGAGLVRISLAADDRQLAEGLARLVAAVRRG